MKSKNYILGQINLIQPMKVINTIFAKNEAKTYTGVNITKAKSRIFGGSTSLSQMHHSRMI